MIEGLNRTAGIRVETDSVVSSAIQIFENVDGSLVVLDVGREVV